MYRPNFQNYFDYFFSLVALGILSVRMEFFDFENIADDKDFKKTFDQLFCKKSELILIFYFLKPFVMAILSRYRGMTNQSYYSQKFYTQRCTFDFFFYFVPSITLYEDDKFTIGQFLILTLPILIVEFFIYQLSVREGNVRAQKIHFRLIKEHITTTEQNNEMFSSDDEDHNECGHFEGEGASEDTSVRS